MPFGFLHPFHNQLFHKISHAPSNVWLLGFVSVPSTNEWSLLESNYSRLFSTSIAQYFSAFLFLYFIFLNTKVIFYWIFSLFTFQMLSLFLVSPGGGNPITSSLPLLLCRCSSNHPPPHPRFLCTGSSIKPS